MYSGTTLNNFSGNLVGAHQKIDRVAYKAMQAVTGTKHFPSIKDILYFEGRNGPDGIKAKSPAQDEPWHYYDPFDPEDTGLLKMINEHYESLVIHLKEKNLEKSAFEASWLAHALVDGLTPAHHYPYEEAITNLRGGEGIHTRTNIKEKLVMKGETKSEFVKNNWLMWGFKGIMVTHGGFEFGVSAIIAPLRFKSAYLTQMDIKQAQEHGPIEIFEQSARRVALWDMYTEFQKYGWTVPLARQVRDELAPLMIKVVAMIWYLALKEAGFTTRTP